MEVKIKTWKALTEAGRNPEAHVIYAPCGERHRFPYGLEIALPKDRIIEVHNDGTFVHEGRVFKIGNWMIEPDAIDDQSQAIGEGRLK